MFNNMASVTENWDKKDTVVYTFLDNSELQCELDILKPNAVPLFIFIKDPDGKMQMKPPIIKSQICPNCVWKGDKREPCEVCGTEGYIE